MGSGDTCRASTGAQNSDPNASPAPMGRGNAHVLKVICAPMVVPTRHGVIVGPAWAVISYTAVRVLVPAISVSWALREVMQVAMSRTL